jgi:hypothetical protein
MAAGDEFYAMACEHCDRVFWYDTAAVPTNLAFAYFHLHVLSCRTHLLMRGELEEDDKELLSRWHFELLADGGQDV